MQPTYLLNPKIRIFYSSIYPSTRFYSVPYFVMNSFFYRILHRVILSPNMRKISMSNKLQDEALEALKSNPYFDKYSNKILEKQKISPKEFYSRLEEHQQKKNNKRHGGKEEKRTLCAGQAKSKTLPLKSTDNLEKIMKIELLQEKTGDEIKKIWEEFHRSKENTLSATIPVGTFKLIQYKAKEHPTFLLPLPRIQGYELIMLQFGLNEVHFTPLISYQTHGENAAECLAIMYYPELMDEKNVVLMKGEYDKNALNPMEAQCLCNQLQLFYGENHEKRDNIMRLFTYHPNEFKHMDLIAGIECLSF